MSVYFVKERGQWRYEFQMDKETYSSPTFKTKTKAKLAEMEKRKALSNPQPEVEIPIDMVFLDLVNLRLDYVKVYNSDEHYRSYLYLARRWTKEWGDLMCSEINRLKWEDVNFQDRYVILYTRKKKGGHLTPRKVHMTQKLYSVLQHRYNNHNPDKPWVFWHRYWSRKAGKFCEGPYGDRKKLMKRLCEKAGVRYFRFHPLRHAGATTMDINHVPIGAIQSILGHENRKTTEIYLYSIGDLERAAMVVFEQAREKSHTGT